LVNLLLQVPRYVDGDEKHHTDKHDNEVTGIAYVRTLVGEEDLTVLAHEITSVFGAGPIRSSANVVVWAFQSTKQEYILCSPQSDEEYEHYAQHGGGLYEIAFHSGIGVKGDAIFVCPEHGKVLLRPGA
jgi:4-hydroxyphenylpyruvate dioxygenase-like putative hemolysin